MRTRVAARSGRAVAFPRHAAIRYRKCTATIRAFSQRCISIIMQPGAPAQIGRVQAIARQKTTRESVGRQHILRVRRRIGRLSCRYPPAAAGDREAPGRGPPQRRWLLRRRRPPRAPPQGYGLHGSRYFLMTAADSRSGGAVFQDASLFSFTPIRAPGSRLPFGFARLFPAARYRRRLRRPCWLLWRSVE